MFYASIIRLKAFQERFFSHPMVTTGRRGGKPVLTSAYAVLIEKGL